MLSNPVMNKSDIAKLALAALSLAPSAASAITMAPGATMKSSSVALSRPYVGMSFNFARLNVDFTSSNGGQRSFDVDNNSLAGGILGMRVTPNVAFEIRGYSNASQGEYLGYRVSVDHYYGAFTRFIVPFTPFFEAYGLMGFGTHKFSVLDRSASDSDIAYGMGISMRLAMPAEIQLEWLNTYNDQFEDDGYTVDIDQSNINLNLVFSF